jgi:hypothetical protein
VLGRALAREDEREKKRGCDGDGAPFIGGAAGSGRTGHGRHHAAARRGGGG